MTIAARASELPWPFPLPHDPQSNSAIQYVTRPRQLTQYTIELARWIVADWHGGTEQEADDFIRSLDLLPGLLSELGVHDLPPIGSYLFIVLPEGGGIDLPNGAALISWVSD